MIYIGIDPDVDKSGFAILSNGELTLFNKTFFDIFGSLEDLILKYGTKGITVYIECGFLNKSNWHAIAKGSAALNASIGNKTGANHQVSRHLIEMCKYLGLNYKEVRPTKSKLSAETFNALTKYKGRTNPEQRDSAMLVWGLK
jgi:hypothetical protein